MVAPSNARVERQPLPLRRQLTIEIGERDPGLHRRREIAVTMDHLAIQPRGAEHDVDL